jgi:hypothetical protein
VFAVTAGRPELAARAPRARGLVIEALWEVIENTPWVTERYRDVTASGDYVGDR